MSFRATIRSGQITFNGPVLTQRWREWLAANDGAIVEIEKAEPGRSIGQNRMYRAWLDSTANHTGNNAEELHEFLLQKCAPHVFVKLRGRKGEMEVEQVKRTSVMSKQEMSDYMDKCAALTGYALPTPEQLEAMGYISNYGPMK